MKEKIKKFVKTAVLFILNPRLLLCFGLGWMITNGWSYVLMGLGIWLKSEWMIGISTAYLSLLWFPGTPEKLISVTIAIFLLRWLFPDDEKTLGILKQFYTKIKRAFLLEKQELKEKREKRKAKRKAKKAQKAKKNENNYKPNKKKEKKRKKKKKAHSKHRRG